MQKRFADGSRKVIRQRTHNVRNLAGLMLGAVNCENYDGFVIYFNFLAEELDKIDDALTECEEASKSMVVPREKQDGSDK